jgi:hypothetical protein
MAPRAPDKNPAFVSRRLVDQYGGAMLYQRVTNVWILAGDITV